MLSGMKSQDGKYSLLMYIYRWCQENKKEATKFRDELQCVREAARIDLEQLEKTILEARDEINKMPDQIKQFKKNKCGKLDQFPTIMDQFCNAAEQNVTNLHRDYKDALNYGRKVAKLFAFELENDDVSHLLRVFNDFLAELDKSRAKITHLIAEEKKAEQKRLRKKKAEERLLKNLAKRATKQQLSKKGIVKDAEKVKQENLFKEKLKNRMKAHVRKQTQMMKEFGDEIMEDYDDETETADSAPTSGDEMMPPMNLDDDVNGKPKPPLPPPYNPHNASNGGISHASVQSDASVVVHEQQQGAGGAAATGSTASVTFANTVRFATGAGSGLSQEDIDDVTRAHSARSSNLSNATVLTDPNYSNTNVLALEDEDIPADDNEHGSLVLFFFFVFVLF